MLIALGDVESRLEKITQLVTLIQKKLLQLIAEAPTDIKEAYDQFKEEINNMATVKDLDYLFAKLSGKSGELLMKAIE